MSLRLMCLCLALAGSCRQPAVEQTPTPGTPAPASVAGSSAPAAPPTAAVTPTAPVASEKAKVEEELQSEERETNPTSETVTLTLNISPPVKGLVMWGAKQLARVTPDKPTVELQRPRSSGPLDIEIRAEGFLPHHTRLHSDRNDKVNVRLVRPAEASSLHGFRSSTSAAAAKAKTK
jgi:hypothetical protein